MSADSPSGAPVAPPVIGRDPYPLPDIAPIVSPAMHALMEQYSAAWNGGTEAECEAWDPAALAIAAFEPLTAVDLAAKLMLGLHYLHPTDLDGRLAIDTEHFEVSAAGAILIACFNHLIAADARRLFEVRRLVAGAEA